MIAKHNAFTSALAGSFFLVLSVILVVLGSKFQSREDNFWLGFIGFGILLESSYLAAHFLLKALARPEIAAICSRIIAALVALPLTIITAVLVLWLVQAAFATDSEGITIIALLALLGITLGIPTLLLWRYAIGLLRRIA